MHSDDQDAPTPAIHCGSDNRKVVIVKVATD